MHTYPRTRLATALAVAGTLMASIGMLVACTPLQLDSSGKTRPATDREYRRENWTWSIADGSLKAVKTRCEYADDPANELLSAGDCRPPLEYDIPIKVNGNAWTIREGDRLMLFRKD